MCGIQIENNKDVEFKTVFLLCYLTHLGLCKEVMLGTLEAHRLLNEQSKSALRKVLHCYKINMFNI